MQARSDENEVASVTTLAILVKAARKAAKTRYVARLGPLAIALTRLFVQINGLLWFEDLPVRFGADLDALLHAWESLLWPSGRQGPSSGPRTTSTSHLNGPRAPGTGILSHELEERFRCLHKVEEAQYKTLSSLIKRCSACFPDTQGIAQLWQQGADLLSTRDGSDHILNHLYDTLQKYLPCQCFEEESRCKGPRHHSAKLRLDFKDGIALYDEVGEPTTADFCLALETPAANLGTKQSRWRYAQILLSRYRLESTEASLDAGLETTQLPSATPNTHEVIQQREAVARSLCERIASSSQIATSFKATRHSLEDLGVSNLSEIPIHIRPGPNLGDFLSSWSLTWRTKVWLAYIVAKTIWRFYNSEWMNTIWSHREIHFLSETLRGEEPQVFCRPYVEIDLLASKISSMEFRTRIDHVPHDAAPSRPQHRYPIVLSLGIMLYEIMTGNTFRSPLPPDCDPRKVNLALAEGMIAINDDNWSRECDSPNLRKAISTCFDIWLFQEVPFVPNDPTKGLQERRTILYERVVRPFEDIVKSLGYLDGQSHVELERTPLKVRRDTPATHEVRKAKAPSRPDTDVSSTYPLSPPLTQPREQDGCDLSFCSSGDNQSTFSKSQTWLDDFEKINEKHLRRHITGDSNIVKIAVLDTGLCDDAPMINYSGTRSNIHWKDFSSEASKPMDEDGHGTHIATLLSRLVPQAHIYVARVATTQDYLPSASNNIVEAIQHAACVWQVDMVCMSFGFRKPVEAIGNKINEVIERRKGLITFFAAAANEGHNRAEMFPASMDTVISIRGTNVAGKPEDMYDPIARPDEVVFGTLSTEVPSNWLRQEEERSMSGCSVATPLAVSVAALLYMYLAQQESFSRTWLRQMRRRQGVCEVFKALEQARKRCYVAPFSFFDDLDADVRLARLTDALEKASRM